MFYVFCSTCARLAMHVSRKTACTCPSRVRYALSGTPQWPIGGLRRTACTCPSRVSYALRGIALRVVRGGSALVPRAELPVQHVLSVPQHLCRIFVSLLSTMCHAAFVPQSVPATPHPPHRVRPHVVLDVTKDQNPAVVFQVKQQTCMCAKFELLEFHVLPLRVPLVTSPLLCSRVPCRVGLRHGRRV